MFAMARGVDGAPVSVVLRFTDSTVHVSQCNTIFSNCSDVCEDRHTVQYPSMELSPVILTKPRLILGQLFFPFRGFNSRRLSFPAKLTKPRLIVVQNFFSISPEQALDMTKFFDTNYHYEVPELESPVVLQPNFDSYLVHSTFLHIHQTAFDSA